MKARRVGIDVDAPFTVENLDSCDVGSSIIDASLATRLEKVCIMKSERTDRRLVPDRIVPRRVGVSPGIHPCSRSRTRSNPHLVDLMRDRRFTILLLRHALRYLSPTNDQCSERPTA